MQAGPTQHGMRVFLVDPHSIYRRGLVACLEGVEEVSTVTDASSVESAWKHPELYEADVVLVDHDLDGAHEFVRDLRERTEASVLVCSGRSDQKELLAAVQAGAVGYLWKETLTPDALVASLRTAATGSGRARARPARRPAPHDRPSARTSSSSRAGSRSRR